MIVFDIAPKNYSRTKDNVNSNILTLSIGHISINWSIPSIFSSSGIKRFSTLPFAAMAVTPRKTGEVIPEKEIPSLIDFLYENSIPIVRMHRFAVTSYRDPILLPKMISSEPMTVEVLQYSSLPGGLPTPVSSAYTMIHNEIGEIYIIPAGKAINIEDTEMLFPTGNYICCNRESFRKVIDMVLDNNNSLFDFLTNNIMSLLKSKYYITAVAQTMITDIHRKQDDDFPF